MRKHVQFILFLLTFSTILIAQTRSTINITNENVNVVSYTDKEIIISGKAELHLTALANTLTNSIINLTTDDSWVFFDNVRPQFVLDNLLKFISINNQLAVNKTNCRIAIYKQGTVVIPQSQNYQPLKVYTGQNFSGDSTSYSLFNFNTTLGLMDNKIRSFKLKRGYMATLANSSDGLGYSRVFIANDKDMEFAVMPQLLDKTVSFIRVVNWEWVSKKGWCGSNFTEYSQLKATWRYDWSAGGTTTPYVEYVPIRQNGGWPGWSEINAKQYVSHVLGFNEPDHTEQSNLTVVQALAQWPDMLKTGLRVGSPAVTNNAWLYAFMDSCKARNYRVDYVAYHAYWGGKSPVNWYNDLKAIYNRTGRPLWITEWNNGANWTTETWPTSDKSLSPANAAKNLADIKAILTVLDTASFIERYSIYNWVQDCRAMVLADTLTPAGKYYATNNSVMAYNSKKEVIPTYTFKSSSLAISFGTKMLTLTINDPNGDYFNGYILEKKIGDGAFTELYNVENTALKTCTDTIDINLASKVRYRAKVRFTNGTISAYTNEIGFNVTSNGDIQTGIIGVDNVTWNNVFFKKPFTSIPSIIIGSPTNLNSTVLVSSRVKLISASSRFSLQLAPWSYQSVTSLTKEESVPYLALLSGTYNFGGLKAIAGRSSVMGAWTQVNFSTPFDTIPVVFTTQLIAATTHATTVRVRNITKLGFEAKLQKETAITTALSTESVSYFAITPGTGMMDDKKIIVGKTLNNAVSTTLYKTITYGDSIPNPIFIAQMQTCNDDTVTATLRCLSVSAKYANVIKQREKSTGVTTAATEGVGWMLINPLSVIQALNTPTLQGLSFYPNPVTDFIFINNVQEQNLNVEIYNLYGILIKKLALKENRIDVAELIAGCYILKTPVHGSTKFIKL